MPKKPKINQPQTPNEIQGRDFFQTPNYAVDLLIPFIPDNISRIWECACGDGKIVKILTEHAYGVYPSDIRKSSGWVNNHIHNFLFDTFPQAFNFYADKIAIITNPPFSLKYKFIYKALEYNIPFAFLVPCEMSVQMWDLIFKKGCQGIVPERRIDYITPTGLNGLMGHTSYYHSFWLTYKFNLPEVLVPVELTKQMKENI